MLSSKAHSLIIYSKKMHGRKVAEAGTIYFATIAYLMDGSLKGKDSITFSEDYNLYVLQTTQSFFTKI